MTPANTLLHTLAELKPTGSFPQRLIVRDPHVQATAEMDVNQIDSLAYQLSMLRVIPDQPVKTALRERAYALAQRVTGLIEKLNVVEIDDQRGEALLRSDQPLVQDQDRYYYEILVEQKGTACLRRYHGSMVKTSRQEVGFTLTREALAKLVADLAK